MHASRNDLAERNEWAAKLAGITKDDPLLTAYARQFLPDETAQPASAPAAIKPAERK
jgi:hypothetical protein